MKKDILILDLIKDSWKQFTNNISFIYYLLAPMFVCSFLGIWFYPDFVALSSESSVNVAETFPAFLLTLLGLLVGFFSTVSILFFFAAGKKDTWKTWPEYFRLLPKYIVVSILQGLLILVGLILFIIPGIYLAVRYAFVSYRTLENPTQSIKELFAAEAQATEGNRFMLLKLGALLLLVTFLFMYVFTLLFPGFMTMNSNPVADFLLELLITPFFTVVSIVAYLRITGRGNETISEKTENSEILETEEEKKIETTSIPEEVL